MNDNTRVPVSLFLCNSLLTNMLVNIFHHGTQFFVEVDIVGLFGVWQRYQRF